VANLIVVQRARSQVEISYWEYFKVGVPVTAASILAGLLLLR
jgi:Na+/H+ antiporter NhaD/arsenite permease-like protein